MRRGIEPGRSRTGGQLAGNAPVALLGAATLTSGVLLVVLSSQLSWRFDDWDILLFRQDWSAHSLLDPHYEHISLSQIVIYKVLLAIFGMDSLVPFSVVSTSVFLLTAVLLFVYLRGRIGDWLALMATTVILFLGAASEDLLWPIQILIFGSMACGLGMLLALQREDRLGDRLACVLLAGSMSFFSLGLAFAAGAAVDVAQRRELWRKRVYIVVIPAILYAIWWLGWGHTGENSLTLHDVGAAPAFVFDTVAAGIASLLGLVDSASESSAQGSLDWGRPLLPIVFLLAVWRFHRLERVPRWFWVVTAIGLTTWTLSALGSQPGRPPDASRYQYATAIFIVLITAELVRGIQSRRDAFIVVGIVVAVSLLGNITFLFDSYESRKQEGEQQRAVLGAVEIARETVPSRFDLADPGGASFSQTLPWVAFAPPTGVSGAAAGPTSDVFTIAAGAYLHAVHDFGSPAYSPRELATSPEPARQAADLALAAALGVKLESSGPALDRGGAPPVLIGPPDALIAQNAGCVSLDASSSAPPLLDLPPGGATLDAGAGSGFQIRLRRYASTILPVSLGELSAEDRAVIDSPSDRSGQPWKLSLEGSGKVDICGLPGDSRS